MAAQPANLRQLSYSAHLEVTMSDHRPVSAEFDVRVRQVDRAEYERHATDLVHSLPVSFGAEVGWEDGESQAELPKLKVEETMIDFGEVRYAPSFFIIFERTPPRPQFMATGISKQ